MKKLFYLSACMLLGLASYSCDNDKPGPVDPPAVPVVSDPTQDIDVPEPSDAVTISATVTGEEITSVMLEWKVNNGTPSSVAMTGDGDLYSGVIPAVETEGATVSYTVLATNEGGTAQKSGSYTVVTATVDYTQLVLNEINGTGEDADKFIEIYNMSATKSIPLEGVTVWYNNISSAPEITWTGTDQVVGPGEFLVLKGTKKDKNPESDMATGLSGTQGIIVEMKDPEGNSIDLFSIHPDAERTTFYARIPDGTGAWCDVSNATEGTTNDQVSGTEITVLPVISVTRDKTAPLATEEVTVTAEVTVLPTGTLESVTFKYSINGNSQGEAPMAAVGNTYTATISAQAVGAEVSYVVNAYYNATDYVQATGDYTVVAAAVDYTGLVINEVDGNGKFVEIYNTSSNTIPLEGVVLVKNGASAWWIGTDGASIAPGGRYTVKNGGTVGEGVDDATGASGISPKKTVQFELKTPAQDVTLDTFARVASGDTGLDLSCTPNYGDAPAYSFSRCPDGTGAFGLAAPSCGAANPATSAGAIVTTLSL